MSTIDKIAALLAMAERSANPHEAEAFLAKAQRLATLTSVDLAVARARIGRRERRDQPISRTTRIGEPGKRANKHLVSLFVAVARSNDVVVDVAHNSTYVVAYGIPADLDVTEAFWASLSHQMVAASNRYLATRQWRSETYPVLAREKRGRISFQVVKEKPHTAQTARASFYRGFIVRIETRLSEARESAIAESDATSAGSVGTEGLAGSDDGKRELPRPRDAGRASGEMVLKAKADEVREFHRTASQARGAWRGYSGGAYADTGSASRAGQEAATRARLASAQGLPGPGAPLPQGKQAGP